MAAPNDGFGVSPPPLTLPKGGGAIRGIGEKFGANPANGTGFHQRPYPDIAGPLRLWSTAVAFVRLWRRKRALRLRLEPVAPSHKDVLVPNAAVFIVIKILTGIALPPYPRAKPILAAQVDPHVTIRGPVGSA